MEITIKKVKRTDFKNCIKHFSNFLNYTMLQKDRDYVEKNCIKCLDHGENCKDQITFEIFE